MTLEETIQSMYDYFPDLFQERWQAINQLFIVIGNGYEWVDGELVYDSDRPPINPLGSDGKAFQYNKREKTRLDLFYPDCHYGVCKGYSYMDVYPEDVKSDWLIGIKEAEDIVKTMPSYDDVERVAKLYRKQQTSTEARRQTPRQIWELLQKESK